MAGESGKTGKVKKSGKKKAGPLPDFEPLRRLTKFVDGGIFFNADGSIVFHSLHTRHLLFLLVPSALLPAAALISWWILLGVPICLLGFIRWLIKRKAAHSLRLDFLSGRIIRGEATAPFAFLTPESFRVVNGPETSTVQCLLPRFEMTLPLEFYDLTGPDEEGFGRSHDERAESFRRLLWQCIAKVRGEEPILDGAAAAKTQLKSAARKKEAARSLSPDKLWMLQLGAMLAPAYGLRPEGLALSASDEDTEAVLRAILKERWNIRTPREAVLAFGDCVQGVRGRLAAVQTLALLPAAVQQGYLDYLEEAAEEICAENSATEAAGLPEELIPPPGPALARLVPLLYEESGSRLLKDYAEALHDANDGDVFKPFLEAEAEICYQARVRRQISVMSGTAWGETEYGRKAWEEALAILDTLLQRIGKDDASRGQALQTLQDVKALRRDLGRNPDYPGLEAERLKTLAQPEWAILLGRNPYKAWDYARAALLKRMTYSLGWENDENGLWLDLRPLAREVQALFNDWTALFPFLLTGQALDGNKALFGSPEEFRRIMQSRGVQNSLLKSGLPPWKTSLKTPRH
ncbi:MAG: DUF1266 domain-containing protein [Deltaproteobacteria bacterium]|jgi:hypothetical protein|nr:DUF1266 domain-containing protein [Deltaproteobacteria bacterium]